MRFFAGNESVRRTATVAWPCLAMYLLATISGCAHHHTPVFGDGDFDQWLALTEVDYPDLREPVVEAVTAVDPTSVPDGADAEYWDLPLQEALWLALDNSKVMRDLGASTLRLPDIAQTVYGPALQETDPQFGVEAALSEFDAIFRGGVSAEDNDRRFNNQVFGLRGILDQYLFDATAEISKRSVLGSQYAIRHSIRSDENNSPTNSFIPRSWDAILEAEARQPLLRGAGVAFNRLAGPNAAPGAANGVLIARTKTDISLAEFEIRVRDFLSNVENAYWDLYFAYRDLDARIASRDASLQTWNYVQGRLGLPGFNAAKEAQAREQYFRFQQQVINSQKGRPVDRTQSNNGSRAGTFRAVPGVRAAERRLRLMLGIPASDRRLIRPLDEPSIANVVYDWDFILQESVERRAELRRQRWRIKRRELELAASKNYLLPQLDLVARYRWRGFGEDLLDPTRDDPADSAYDSLTSGDFQEWQVGVELSAPIGFRRELTAVRHAELRLAREKAMLDEQKRQVIHDVSAAVAEVERAFDSYKLAYDRLQASQEQVSSLKAAAEADRAELDVVLDAQRRYADALSGYYQAQTEYAVALKNVHYEKGSLLEYCGVYLSEGEWPHKAYHDAAEREAWRSSAIHPVHMANPPVAATPMPHDRPFPDVEPLPVQDEGAPVPPDGMFEPEGEPEVLPAPDRQRANPDEGAATIQDAVLSDVFAKQPVARDQPVRPEKTPVPALAPASAELPLGSARPGNALRQGGGPESPRKPEADAAPRPPPDGLRANPRGNVPTQAANQPRSRGGTSIVLERSRGTGRGKLVESSTLLARPISAK